MGRLLLNVQLPDSASVERTEAVMKQATKIILEHPALVHVTAVAGFSFALNAYGSNFGAMFLGIKDFSERRDPKFHTDRIADDLGKAFAEEIPEASIQIFAPPPVAGRGPGRRIRLRGRGSRRRGFLGTAAADGKPRQPGQRKKGAGRASSPSSGPTCRSSWSSRTCASA